MYTTKIEFNLTSSLKVGFNWNFDPQSSNFQDESSDDDESQPDDKQPLDGENRMEKRREKRKSRTPREYEEYLRKKENDLISLNREPETKDDFERMAISSPNSSLVWIKYMTMYIEQKLYDKARQIGERALQTISFREEQEKFNVWIAMLNLENRFGNEESFFILYRRAQLQLEPLKLFKSLIKIHTSNEQFDKADESFAFHQKKLKQYKDYWLDYGLFYYKCNKLDKARNVLEQSLKSLDKQEHVDVISKFAQMEFKSGDIERGKTLFESVLSAYPKRVDLWMVYLDVMQKYGRDEEDNNACVIAIRNIFERLTAIKLKPIRMKTIYKKYLDFETKFGSKNTLERVKEKMKDYIEDNPFNWSVQVCVCK